MRGKGGVDGGAHGLRHVALAPMRRREAVVEIDAPMAGVQRHADVPNGRAVEVHGPVADRVQSHCMRDATLRSASDRR